MSICYFPPPHLPHNIDISRWIIWKAPAWKRERSHSRGGSPCTSPRRTIAETSFHIKRLENAALLILLPPFPDGTQRCTLWAEKMQLKWLYLLRQRYFHVPDTQKHSPKPARAQEWDLALPWHACQNESGGWHTGSQIRVKECVCACVCVLNKNPPSAWNCSSMPEEMHHRPYWENCGSIVFNY